MSRLFGLAGVQMSVAPWDANATIDKMGDTVFQVTRNFPWVNMVLFHELVVPGMVQFVSTEHIDTWKQDAQPIPGPLTDRLCAIAKGNKTWLVPGSMYEVDGSDYYNTAIVISPEGEIVTKYRKMYPWLPYESNVKAGTEYCVFDVPGVGRFGLNICYDMWFPEVTRTLAWMGAEVILHPTMTPTSDRELEVVLSQANAIFNQAYFIDINGVGPYGGGQSMMIDPDGRVLQKAGTHETILTELLDLDRVTRAREVGTLGLSQLLKHWRDAGHAYPPYGLTQQPSETLTKLGRLKFHHTIDDVKHMNNGSQI